MENEDLQKFRDKFTYLKDFFELYEAKNNENGIFNFKFECVKCRPQKRLLKSTRQNAIANLRAHMKSIHAPILSKFEQCKVPKRPRENTYLAQIGTYPV